MLLIAVFSADRQLSLEARLGLSAFYSMNGRLSIFSWLSGLGTGGIGVLVKFYSLKMIFDYVIKFINCTQKIRI